MSIGSALQAGISGLRALSTKLATISDNIANSSTIGYKRYDTQFSSLVLGDGTAQNYSAGGTNSLVRTEIAKSGTIIGGGTTTDLAIAGEGFFTVQSNDGSGDFAFTRAGSFRPDASGALKNTAGYYLQGFALAPDGSYANGTPTLTGFTSLETINISTITGTGRASSEVSFVGNVPQGSVGPFETSVQIYDAFGAPQTLTMNWVNAGANQWTLELYEGPVAGIPVASLQNIDFNGATPGAPDYSATVLGGSAAGLNAAQGTFDITLASGQVLTMNIGEEGSFRGVTQFSGDYLAETIADGAPLGQLQSLEVDENGTMIAIFDNGERRPVYEIPLADVTNPNGLTPADGNVFSLSADSGTFRLQGANSGGLGAISAGALESSNVDIANELTSLIETQRAYSSNATVVRTADEMLEEVTRLKR